MLGVKGGTIRFVNGAGMNSFLSARTQSIAPVKNVEKQLKGQKRESPNY